MQVNAIAAVAADAPLERTTIERREVGEHEVLIAIKYAGICHSDIHTVRSEWGAIAYPVVVGHEIAGVVDEVGPDADKALIGKGAALGTVLAFMMSVIALSLPEVIILRKVLKIPLIAAFAGVVACGILLVGYVFNLVL